MASTWSAAEDIRSMRDEQDRDRNAELRDDRDAYLSSPDFIDDRPTRLEIEMEEHGNQWWRH